MTTEEKFNQLKREGLQILELYNDYKGVDTSKWKIELNNTKHFIGLCKYKLKTIYLSKPYLELNSIEIMRDTLLHEIAHIFNPRDGHGSNFKHTCHTLGCCGFSNCKDKELKSPEGKYKYKCISCGRIASKHRKYTKYHSCGKCSNVFDEKYLLKEIKGE